MVRQVVRARRVRRDVSTPEPAAVQESESEGGAVRVGEGRTAAAVTTSAACPYLDSGRSEFSSDPRQAGRRSTRRLVYRSRANARSARRTRARRLIRRPAGRKAECPSTAPRSVCHGFEQE